jgi:hypothetical protein
VRAEHESVDLIFVISREKRREEERDERGPVHSEQPELPAARRRGVIVDLSDRLMLLHHPSVRPESPPLMVLGSALA